jgi:hypothetical protein
VVVSRVDVKEFAKQLDEAPTLGVARNALTPQCQGTINTRLYITEQLQ